LPIKAKRRKGRQIINNLIPEAMKNLKAKMLDEFLINKNIASVTLLRARVIFWKLKAPGGCNSQWTLNSYGKVDPTSLFSFDVQRKKKIEFHSS